MTWFDHLFILVLLVVQPIHGARSYRAFVERAKAGRAGVIRREYHLTMLIEWAALAVMSVGWFLLDRPAAALGMVAPAGVGFMIGAGLVVLMCALLLLSHRQVLNLATEDRSKQLDSMGDLVHILPRTSADLRSFNALSVTAGVVEEILYRGFVIWYLLHAMPLWAAVIVSSVLFALAHSYQGLSGAVKTGVVGLAMAGLYVLTGSIWLPIVAHVLLDLLQGRTLFALMQAEPTPD